MREAVQAAKTASAKVLRPQSPALSRNQTPEWPQRVSKRQSVAYESGGVGRQGQPWAASRRPLDRLGTTIELVGTS